ncbi:MAG: DMT family transporter, partial [Oscillospiraceae bacterium]
MNKTRCSLCVLAAASLWGCIGVFLHPLTALGLTALQIVVVRTAGSALLLTAALGLFRPGLLRIDWRDGWIFFGTGVLSLLFFNWCYFGAIREVGLSVAAVLLYTSPIFVLLLSAALFGERLTRRKLLALGLTFAGCALVTGALGQSGAIGARGLLLGLGAGFGYALYSIFGRFALRKYASLTITVWTFLCCGAASLLLAACTDGLPPMRWLVAEKSGLFAVLGLTLLCCVLPYFLYTAGLSGIETGRAAMLATVEPAV